MLMPARAAVALCVAAILAVSGCDSPTSGKAIASPQAPTTTTSQPITGSDEWVAVGTSVQGKPIRARTLGNGPRKVLFIGGIHGDESEGAYSTDQLPAAFTDAGLADAVTLTIIEDANPDGRAAGTRDNANGVDVNRNFPASNFDSASPANGGKPLSQPESRAVYDTVNRIGPALIVVAHSWVGSQFINFDGPAREIAEQFSQSSGLPVQTSSSFAPTPGSLGSYFGRDRGIAVLTIELLKGSDGKADWEQIHDALMKAIRG
ncbi:MAG TPA: M14 family zinc carboxypeptidase [Mycobacterium sp.]|nr:M14 family zinc carboxypeptidase [Mycobacterium sp.]